MQIYVIDFFCCILTQYTNSASSLSKYTLQISFRAVFHWNYILSYVKEMGLLKLYIYTYLCWVSVSLNPLSYGEHETQFPVPKLEDNLETLYCLHKMCHIALVQLCAGLYRQYILWESFA